MRVVLTLVLGASLLACGEEPPEVVAVASPPTVAAAPPATVQLAPSHGGSAVAAGPYAFEVVPHASGEVHAYVPPGVEPPPGAELRVDVPVEGRDRKRPVRLRWDAEKSRYEGRVRRVTIAPGPVDVHYTVHEQVYVGSVTILVIAPAIEVHVDAPRVRVRHKHKHKHHMGMRHKHRRRHHGGIEIEIGH